MTAFGCPEKDQVCKPSAQPHSIQSMETDNSTTAAGANTPDEEQVLPDPASVALAKPISFEAKYGAGKKRTLVLGGGGVYFVAWQVSYLNGLMKAGVRLDSAEIVVGTSAGSVVASILANGGLKRFGRQFDWISRVPALVGMLAPAANFHPSQMRAIDMFRGADNARPETIREIGHAALAAHAPTAAEMRRSTGFAIASRGWPSPALNITTVDCFTGERLVVTQSAGVAVIRAAAASSAVPGVFSPQPILDRYCMDGGVSGTGTHCDLVAGSERAIVISLGASLKQDAATMTIQPGNLQYEAEQLRLAGTESLTRGPSRVDMDKLMDPKEVPDAMALGEQQAAEDAVDIGAFWGP